MTDQIEITAIEAWALKLMAARMICHTSTNIADDGLEILNALRGKYWVMHHCTPSHREDANCCECSGQGWCEYEAMTVTLKTATGACEPDPRGWDWRDGPSPTEGYLWMTLAESELNIVSNSSYQDIFKGIVLDRRLVAPELNATITAHADFMDGQADEANNPF